MSRIIYFKGKDMGYTKNAFTLVELIVVITILAILSTIGFVSYSTYLTGARDTNRSSQLVSINDGLEIFRAKNELPLPDDNVRIQTDNASTIIGYQGYIGRDILEGMNYSKGGLDPKDSTYFTYYVTKDKKYFQLMAYLEEESNINPIAFVPEVYAVDYLARYPIVYGKKLGILTEDVSNAPVQEVASVQAQGYIDISNLGASIFTAHLSDNETITGSGDTLLSSNPYANCKRIKEIGAARGDGHYLIYPAGPTAIQVYCDMTIDGGGWTLIGRSTGTGSGFFGYGSTLGDVTDDTEPYSYGLSTGRAIGFSEILFGNYTSGKRWGELIYKKVGDINFPLYLGTSFDSDTIVLGGECLGYDLTEFEYTGFTGNTGNFYLNGTGGQNTTSGLTLTGFGHTGTGCTGGGLGGSQGMFFIR